jgi:hypothetical protein
MQENAGSGLLLKGIHQLAQTGNLAACRSLVNDPFAGSLVDIGDSTIQSRLSSLEIAPGNGLADLFDESSHGGPDMSVASIPDRVLLVTFDS